jgi:excisionase family DNA binding protein
VERVPDEWLSLSDVAEMLGVHPSTVRLWSDKGVLPVHRTQGGHRRYRRSEVELWERSTRQPRLAEPANVIQHAMKSMRFRIAEGQLAAEPWYQKLDNEARNQYRQSASVLVQGLAGYLSAEGEQAIAEARSLGYEYASRGRRCGLSTVEATRAFLFFRNLLLESMVGLYHQANVPHGEAWQEMLKRIHTFTDQIMLSLLETYQAFEGNHR